MIGIKYYVIEILLVVYYIMGGVCININVEVFGKNGRLIKGFYVVGEVIGGIYGVNRIGGNVVVDIIIFGKIVGENVVIYLKFVK